jgi:hypothetical protein
MTGSVYAVTSYEVLGDGNFKAKRKHDVTADFEGLTAVLVGEEAAKLRAEEEAPLRTMLARWREQQESARSTRDARCIEIGRLADELQVVLDG